MTIDEDTWDRLLPAGQLRLLDALHASRSVSRSAELLGISQPTASQWLNRLRSHFNDALFVRAGGQMRPTPRADEIVQTARTALEALKVLSSGTRAFNRETSTRTFRLQAPAGTHLTLVPGLLRVMRSQAPGVKLVVSPLSEHPEDDLRTDRIDLALALATPGLQQEFRSRGLGTQAWVCLGSQSTLNDKELTAAAYQDAKHVNITHAGWSELLDLHFAGETWRRDVVLSLPSVFGLPELLLESDLIATLPRHIGSALSNAGGSGPRRLSMTPCPFRIPPVPSSAYWSQRHDQDPGHRWFRELLMSAFVSVEDESDHQ